MELLEEGGEEGVDGGSVLGNGIGGLEGGGELAGEELFCGEVDGAEDVLEGWGFGRVEEEVDVIPRTARNLDFDPRENSLESTIVNWLILEIWTSLRSSILAVLARSKSKFRAVLGITQRRKDRTAWEKLFSTNILNFRSLIFYA